MAERWLTDLADLVADAERSGVPVYVAETTVIEEMTGFHLHRGALASMHRPELPTPQALLAGARRVVVLEDIVDHTNVGAIFRTCAALGVDAVLVTPRCADPLYRRSDSGLDGHGVPGALDPHRALARGPRATLRDSGFRVAAFALTDDAVSLDDLAADPPERLALVLGAEGDGLSHADDRAARTSSYRSRWRGSGLPERGCGERSGPVGPAPAAAD